MGRKRTDAEAALLRTLGVDYGQGWHFGRPGPPEALAPMQRATLPVPRSSREAAPSLPS